MPKLTKRQTVTVKQSPVVAESLHHRHLASVHGVDTAAVAQTTSKTPYATWRYVAHNVKTR